ncbi:dTDP-glucose 4,6-dehydratase [subsurface metagenome]
MEISVQNILVTGGAGFIGSNFIRSMLAADNNFSIINLDALTYAGSMENLKDLPDPARHVFVHGDICDGDLIDDVFRRYTIDTVVHFAAESHVDRSISNPELFVRTNVTGTAALLESARRYWHDKNVLRSGQVRFHHVSTDEVYGSLGPDEPAWTENIPYSPNSPYAATKAAADHLVRAYGHTYGLPYTISNCSNNYGPYQFPEKLIPLTILHAVEGEPLPVYGDGGQIRDWLYVEDHCEAIRRILLNDTTRETFNIGGGTQPTNLEIVHNIYEIMDARLPDSPFFPHRDLIRFVDDRPGHDRRYAMDSTKINRELGWAPSCSLKEGLSENVMPFFSVSPLLSSFSLVSSPGESAIRASRSNSLSSVFS